MLKKSKLQEKAEYFIDTALSVFKILLLSKFIRFPKHKIASSECVILANGPSLNDFIAANKGFLMNKDTLCVNFFPTTGYYADVKPNYCVINAPEMWIDDVEDHYITSRESLFQAIAEKTHWPLTLFMPVAARRYPSWQKAVKVNKYITIAFYNTTPIDGFRSFVHFCFRHQLGMPRPHNVLIPSIMLALHLQYKTIYLAGADHSWLKDLWVSDENLVLLTQKHFYDEKTARAEPMRQLGRNQRKLHEVLIKFVHAFRGYFVINDYAISCGTKIINITPGSFIDAFERMKI